MRVELVKVVALCALFLVTLLSVVLPLKFKNVRKQVLSTINCFCGGLFLGFCFLHLLPDVEEDMQQAFQGKEASSGNFPFAGFMVALGLLLILVIEKLVELCKSTSDKSHIPSEQLPSPSGPSGEPITELSPLLHEKVKSSTPSEQIKWNSHQTENGAIEMPPPVDVPKASTNEVLSSSTNECDNVETTQLLAKIRAICMVLALTVHSVLEGLVVGLQDTAQGVSEIVVMIGIHKVIVAFSLGITLLKSERSKLAHIGKAVIFSIASPLGALIGLLLTGYKMGDAHRRASAFLTGIATGTFMYITFFEILAVDLKIKRRTDVLKLLFFVLSFVLYAILRRFVMGEQ